MPCRSKARFLSSVSACAALLVLHPAQAQEAMPPSPPAIPEAPSVTVPFDLLATSLGSADGVPIGGNNAVLRFNGETGETLDPFLTPADSDLFNDPRDIVLDGSVSDPNASFLIHTGNFPASETPDFDNIIRVDLDGNVVELVGDFSEDPDVGFVDAGGGVFGPGDNFFSGSRASGEIIETNPATGDVLGPIDADFSGVDFPRGFVFDAQGNLYLGNGSDPGTGEGTDQILFFANNGDGTFADPVEFAAPEGFSPLDVILSPDGSQLVVSSEFPFEGGATPNPGQIFVFDIDPADPSMPTDFTTFNPTDGDGTSLIVAPRGLGFGPDGLLYSSSTGTDQIFRFDFATGELVDDGAFAETPDLFGQAVNFVTLFGECEASGCAGRFVDADGFSSDDGGDFVVEEGVLVQGPLELAGADLNVEINGQVASDEDGALALAVAGGTTTVNGLVDSTGAGAASLVMLSVDGTVSVAADGFVTSSGASGVSVGLAGSGNSLIVDGTVLASGEGSAGVLATGVEASLVVAEGGGVFNDAATTGIGIVLIDPSGESSLEVAGTVATTGVFSDAIVVGIDSVTVASTGTVSTEGDFSAGIATLGDASVLIEGTVQTFGDTAPGLRVESATQVTNSGSSIMTQGAGSAGILALGDAVITNTGVIETSGASTDAPIGLIIDPLSTPTAELENIPAAGIILADGGASITNSGTITAASGPAIYSSSDLAAFQNGGSVAGLEANTILNNPAGVITGTVAILGGELSEEVFNFGTLNGSVLLGGGNDTVFVDFATAVVNGSLNGGTGVDTLILSGPAVLNGVSGFETLDLSQATAVTLNGVTTLDALDIAAGQQITLGVGGTTTLADGLTVGAGSITMINGTLTTGGQDGVPALTGAGMADGAEVIVDGGVVTTAGDNAAAIGLFGSAGVQVALNGGVTTDGGPLINASTTGDGSAGVRIGPDSQLTIANGAGVRTEGDLALGVEAGSAGSVVIDGTVETLGDGAIGVQIGSAGDLTIGAMGRVETMGDGAPGVFVAGSDASVTVDGAIATQGVAADGLPPAGIIVAGGGNTVAVNGTVTSENGPGIYVSSDLAEQLAGGPLADPSNDIVIGEGGSVSGAVGVQGGSLNETVTVLGSVSGGIVLNGGDDVVTLSLDTGSLDGALSGGDGVDALTLVGGGAFDLTGSSGFEIFSLDGDTINLSGSAAFQTVDILGETAVTLDGATLGAVGGVTIAEGAALNGEGSIGGPLTNAGTVSPGASTLSFGTLSVGGNYSQTGTGNLVIDFGSGGSDTLLVSGTADLAGDIDLVPQAGTNFGDIGGSLFVVGAQGISGAVASETIDITDTSGGFSIEATPVVSGGSLFYNLVTTAAISGGLALTGNDAILGDALDDVFNFNAAGSLQRQQIFDLVQGGAAAIKTASPEFYDGAISAGITIGDRYMEQIHERLMVDARRGSGVWASVVTGSDERDPEGFGYQIDHITFAFGVDYTLGPVIVGLSGNYSDSNVDSSLSTGFSLGDSEVEALGGSVYFGTAFERGFNVQGSVGYQFLDIRTARNLDLGSGAAGSQLFADFDPGQLIAEVRSTYTLALTDSFFARPRIGVDFVVTESETFEEVGNGALGLNVAAQSYEEIGGTAGLDFYGVFGGVEPFLGGFVRHNFQDDGREFAFSVQGLPNSLFRLVTEDDRTEAGVRVGVRANLFNTGAWVQLGYDGRFSIEGNNESHEFQGRIIIPF